MAATRTHYDILAIDRDADDAAVRRAWKTLVQVWHPDRFTGDMRDDAERMTMRINESYHVLRDESRRRVYDRRLADELAAAGPATSRTGRDSTSTSTGSAYRATTASPFRTTRGPQRPTTTDRYSAPYGDAVTLVEKSPADVFVESVQELAKNVRRHPRLALAGVALWALIIGGTFLSNATTPTLPARQSIPVVDSTALELPTPDSDVVSPGDGVAGADVTDIPPADDGAANELAQVDDNGMLHAAPADDYAVETRADGRKILTVRPNKAR